MLDFIRIACAVPRVSPGDVAANVQEICGFLQQADSQGADILLFPELSLTGYTCGDLFFQEALYAAVDKGMEELLRVTRQYPRLTAVVGLPVQLEGRYANCAAVVENGSIRTVVSKSYIPDYDGFHEARWFSPVEEAKTAIAGQTVTVRREVVFPVGDARVGIELCEDLLSPIPPSSFLTLSGADVILNLSASPEQAGKKAWRSRYVQNQSEKCKCIYAYVSAGCTESTSDTVYSGHCVIAENGKVLQESKGFAESGYLLASDCDFGLIRAMRRKNTTFRASAEEFGADSLLEQPSHSLRGDGSAYPVCKTPFLPENRQEQEAYCKEIFQLQVTGLKRRLSAIGAKPVLGISGGLDSTLALLVAVEAMAQLGRPSSDVIGITMPCFGTSDRTYQNAWTLMKKLGITPKEIPIKAAVEQHFMDIGHDEAQHNATYENSQARERTQILMDYASMVGGIVVGTGDLSELALGWCTYNGDHMSMYGVNASVPKTLMAPIISAVAKLERFACVAEALQDVVATPISPELLPPDEKGAISQQTEELVGPYALHDFFLYHMLHNGFGPEKTYFLACRAFSGEYSGETVKKWLVSFYRRFFSQQFKRNCMPDGMSTGPVSLAPRGGWMMPSDVCGRLWIRQAENL